MTRQKSTGLAFVFLCAGWVVASSTMSVSSVAVTEPQSVTAAMDCEKCDPYTKAGEVYWDCVAAGAGGENSTPENPVRVSKVSVRRP